MPDPAPETVQAADTTTTPESLHEAADAAVTAWQGESDPAKATELKTAATTAVELARKALDAQKVSAAANKPPDKYELKAPEGSLLKPEHLEELAAFAKANKLTQAQAELLVNRESTSVSRFFDAQKAEVVTTQAEWAKLNLADPEVGGDAAKLKAYAEGANRVLQKFAPAGMAQELAKTGLGNNPQLLKLLHNVFKSMSEDELVRPGAESTEAPSAGKVLFSKSLKDAGAPSA